MKTRFAIVAIFIFLLSAGIETTFAQISKGQVPRVLTNDVYDVIDANNVLLWMSNNGDMGFNPQMQAQGLEWPKGSGKKAMFEEGLVFGGLLQGEIRVGGSTYRHGLLAGFIKPDGDPSDPADPRYRIYKVFNIGKAEYDTMNAAAQAKFLNDFMEWPVSNGAPFIDSNHNGTYDPDFTAWLADSTKSDKPWFVGDQVLWFVSNDLDPIRTQTLYGTSPMGIEIQTMVWGYTRGGPLANALFIKHTLINKGTDDLTDFYIAKWMDSDLGDANDDFVGVDTVLNMAYSYNGKMKDGVYGIPPAQGCILAQGPIVPDPEHTARFNFGERSLYRNLPISSFVFHFNGTTTYQDPRLGDPTGALEMYNYFRGFSWQGNRLIDPVTNLPTKITLAGDPVTGQGWIDGIVTGPGDRRMMLACGPFTFAKGDTQEIVFSTLLSQGGTSLNSVEELRKDAATIKTFFNSLPVNKEVPDISLRVSYPGPNAARVFMTAKSFTASSVSGVIKNKSGALLTEYPMYDDGLHDDGSAGDRLYGGGWDTTRILEGVDCFVRCYYSDSKSADWIAGKCVPLAGPVKNSLYKIESDHLNFDGIPNPGENIRFTTELANQTPFIIGPWSILASAGSPKGLAQYVTLSASIPALQSDHMQYVPSDASSFVSFDIPASATDGQEFLIPTVISDQNYNVWRDTIRITAKALSIPPVDSLMIHLAGPATGKLGWRVADKNALLDHTYIITMQGEWDVDTGNGLRALLINDLTASKELLRGKYFPDVYAHEMPATDGWKVTQGTASYEPAFTSSYNPPEHHWLIPNGESYSWMSGIDWGWGSTMGLYDLVPVKIIFDGTQKQKAYSYLRGGTPAWGYQGYFDVPMRAYDVSDPGNPRQINLAFVENNGAPTHDQTWMPSMDATSREYLFILKSSYSTMPDAFYTSLNIRTDAGKMDILYGSWYYRAADSLMFHDGDYFMLQPTVPVSYRDTFLLNPKGPLNAIGQVGATHGLSLSQNYPNPFTPSTSISFTLPTRAFVSLKIYDPLGREVATVVSEELQAGNYTRRWKPNDAPSGTYFYRLQAGALSETRKLVLVR